VREPGPAPCSARPQAACARGPKSKNTRNFNPASKTQPHAVGKYFPLCIPLDGKFPIRELCVSGIPGLETNKSREPPSTQKCADSVRLTRHQPLVIAVLDEAREALMHFNSYFQYCPRTRGAIIVDGWTGSVAFRSITSRPGHPFRFGVGEIEDAVQGQATA
jgi:hypothetical protein